MGNIGRCNERKFMKSVSDKSSGVNFKIILIIFWTPKTFVGLISVVGAVSKTLVLVKINEIYSEVKCIPRDKIQGRKIA